MNFRNTLTIALVSAGLSVMSATALAKGPEQVKQYSPQMEHQAPAKPGYKQVNPQKNKVRYIRVHKGDTLGKIARKYHTSVIQLKRLNHLRSDVIYVGQRLRVR